MQIDPKSYINNIYGQKANQTQSKLKKQPNEEFGKSVNEYIKNVNDDQVNADTSIKEMLTGKNQDINSVVSAVAKADSSFNLLVGVRNKLIEAYKETMRMQV